MSFTTFFIINATITFCIVLYLKQKHEIDSVIECHVWFSTFIITMIVGLFLFVVVLDLDTDGI